MKILALLLLNLILLTISVDAQDKFTTYENVYAKETFDIQITLKDNSMFTLYINALSLDKLRDKGGFMVDNSQYNAFIDALNQAKLKYNEWVETAKKNNISELDKEMKIKNKVSAFFLYGNDWHFQLTVDLRFDFKILESAGEIKYLLIVRSGELKSANNRFINVDGVVLVFSSESEIEDFLEGISEEKINTFRTKPKAEDLFKD